MGANLKFEADDPIFQTYYPDIGVADADPRSRRRDELAKDAVRSSLFIQGMDFAEESGIEFDDIAKSGAEIDAHLARLLGHAEYAALAKDLYTQTLSTPTYLMDRFRDKFRVAIRNDNHFANIYQVDGRVFCRTVSIDPTLEVASEGDMPAQRYPLPGTIVADYEFTHAGVRLVSTTFSNPVLKRICLEDVAPKRGETRDAFLKQLSDEAIAKEKETETEIDRRMRTGAYPESLVLPLARLGFEGIEPIQRLWQASRRGGVSPQLAKYVIDLVTELIQRPFDVHVKQVLSSIAKKLRDRAFKDSMVAAVETVCRASERRSLLRPRDRSIITVLRDAEDAGDGVGPAEEPELAVSPSQTRILFGNFLRNTFLSPAIRQYAEYLFINPDTPAELLDLARESITQDQALQVVSGHSNLLVVKWWKFLSEYQNPLLNPIPEIRAKIAGLCRSVSLFFVVKQYLLSIDAALSNLDVEGSFVLKLKVRGMWECIQYLLTADNVLLDEDFIHRYRGLSRELCASGNPSLVEMGTAMWDLLDDMRFRTVPQYHDEGSFLSASARTVSRLLHTLTSNPKPSTFQDYRNLFVNGFFRDIANGVLRIDGHFLPSPQKSRTRLPDSDPEEIRHSAIAALAPDLKPEEHNALLPKGIYQDALDFSLSALSTEGLKRVMEHYHSSLRDVGFSLLMHQLGWSQSLSYTESNLSVDGLGQIYLEGSFYANYTHTTSKGVVHTLPVEAHYQYRLTEQGFQLMAVQFDHQKLKELFENTDRKLSDREFKTWKFSSKIATELKRKQSAKIYAARNSLIEAAGRLGRQDDPLIRAITRAVLQYHMHDHAEDQVSPAPVDVRVLLPRVLELTEQCLINPQKIDAYRALLHHPELPDEIRNAMLAFSDALTGALQLSEQIETIEAMPLVSGNTEIQEIVTSIRSLLEKTSDTELSWHQRQQLALLFKQVQELLEEKPVALYHDSVFSEMTRLVRRMRTNDVIGHSLGQILVQVEQLPLAIERILDIPLATEVAVKPMAEDIKQFSDVAHKLVGGNSAYSLFCAAARTSMLRCAAGFPVSNEALVEYDQFLSIAYRDSELAWQQIAKDYLDTLGELSEDQLKTMPPGNYRELLMNFSRGTLMSSEDNREFLLIFHQQFPKEKKACDVCEDMLESCATCKVSGAREQRLREIRNVDALYRTMETYRARLARHLYEKVCDQDTINLKARTAAGQQHAISQNLLSGLSSFRAAAASCTSPFVQNFVAEVLQTATAYALAPSLATAEACRRKVSRLDPLVQAGMDPHLTNLLAEYRVALERESYQLAKEQLIANRQALCTADSWRYQNIEKLIEFSDALALEQGYSKETLDVLTQILDIVTANLRDEQNWKLGLNRCIKLLERMPWDNQAKLGCLELVVGSLILAGAAGLFISTFGLAIVPFILGAAVGGVASGVSLALVVHGESQRRESKQTTKQHLLSTIKSVEDTSPKTKAKPESLVSYGAARARFLSHPQPKETDKTKEGTDDTMKGHKRSSSH